MKTLVLFRSVNEYYFDHINLKNVDVCGLYKNTPSIFEFPRKVAKNLGLKLVQLFYDDWFKKLDQYDKIIVFDIAFLTDRYLLRNISKRTKCKKLFLYSWNIVVDESVLNLQKQRASEAGFEIFHYDKGTCKKYNLFHNSIMYDATLSIKRCVPKNDLIFLGFLKDRKSKISILYNELTKAGLVPKFVIVGESIHDGPFEYRDTYVNYYEYLKMIEQSRAILDISQRNQDGYSMRVMEAIFFDKKLVTTNIHLREADFFDPNRILVIDMENIVGSEIKAFLQSPFIEYPDSVKEYYSFERWIDRFDLSEERINDK